MSELAMTTGLQTGSESFFAPLNSVEVHKGTTTYPILYCNSSLMAALTLSFSAPHSLLPLATETYCKQTQVV
jgi:hypothetical protein